ncbi:hypothetical protein [Nocardia blacklockiae]|uniref:hypothetical protein n=1 Tax=Nocardia blacklockiae TaxID=480036 RepID=UPI001895F236|nr:hypothetical protein [Nocardia blacklockiae]MBF6172023.1 hypothetical protein [Nocardia blacklockiae]
MDRMLRQAENDVVQRFWSILDSPATVDIAAQETGVLRDNAADGDCVLLPTRMSTGEVILVPVPRRDFVLGIGAGVAGAALSAGPLAALFANTDIDHIRHFLDKRMSIIESDNLYRSRETLPEVLTAIKRMQALRAAKVVDSQSILRLLAMYAETAAWQLQDQHMFDESQRWAEKALTWSHQLGDSHYVGLSLVRMSQLACDMHDYEGGQEFAEEARRSAPPDSLFAAAAVTFGAHARALAGDPNGSARAYDSARGTVDRAETDPAWGFFLDQSYIDAHQAHSSAETGDFASATRQFADATDRMQTGYPRDGGVYLARAAVAHMAAGEIEPAARLGVEALRIGIGTESGRIMAKVVQLRETIDVASRQAGVGEFVDEYEEWKDSGWPDRM